MTDITLSRTQLTDLMADALEDIMENYDRGWEYEHLVLAARKFVGPLARVPNGGMT